jgi:acyl carrier protein
MEASLGVSRALRLIADVLQVDAEWLSADTVADDIATWDSMALVELVFMLQREYGLSLQIQEATALTSVSAILELIRKAGKLE